MEDDFPPDPTLMQVEAICQLVDALASTTNKDIRRRLLQAMDLVIAKLGPPRTNQSSVIDVTRGRH
jgi:hypothetical protein